MNSIHKYILILFTLSIFITISCDDNFYDIMTTENNLSKGIDDKWKEISVDIPGREGMITIVDNLHNRTYIYGGREYGTARNDLWVIDNTNNSAQYLNNGYDSDGNDYTRAFGAGTIINNILYIFGGIDSSNATTNITLKYDITNDTWTYMGTSAFNGGLPDARYRHCGFTYNNIFYIQGGKTAFEEGFTTNNITDTLWSVDFDVSGKPQWIQLSNGPAFIDASAVVINSDIYFYGGYLYLSTSPSGVFSNILWKYDPVADTYTQISFAPSIEGRAASAMTIYGNTLYIISGYNGSVISNILTYDTSNSTWDTIDQDTAVRYNHSTWIDNSTIFIFGGKSDSSDLYPEKIWTYSVE